MIPVEQAGLLLAAAFGAGALNAAAGGGSFLTLPALVLTGMPPVMANATGTAALLPGYAAGAWGFREGLRAPAGVSFLTLAIVSTVAGAFGAALLLLTGDDAFGALLPWLLLAATALQVLGERDLNAMNGVKLDAVDAAGHGRVACRNAVPASGSMQPVTTAMSRASSSATASSAGLAKHDEQVRTNVE